MEIKPGRYLIGMWFAAAEGHDFMLTLYTDGDPNGDKTEWTAEYRFRYYDESDPDNDAFSGKDRKSFYTGTFTGSQDEAYATTLEFMDRLRSLTGKSLYHSFSFMPLFSADVKFIAEQLTQQPWAHVKKVTPEEYAKYSEKREDEKAPD